MKKNILLFAVFAILCCTAVACRLTTDNPAASPFIGTWKYDNKAESTSVTIVFKQSSYELTKIVKAKGSSKKTTYNAKYTFDDNNIYSKSLVFNGNIEKKTIPYKLENVKLTLTVDGKKEVYTKQ